MTSFKAILKGSSILVATCAILVSASDVQAAEKAKKMSLTISGSFVSVIGFGEQNANFESTANSTSRTGYDSFNMWNNSEIHFKGTTKLDNGLTVAVHIELETDQSTAGGGHSSSAANDSKNNTIDASYITVVGGFGTILTGTTNNVTKVLGNVAPAVGVTSSNDGDGDRIIVVPSSVGVTADTHLVGGKYMAIAYISPAFSGFTFAASYIPSVSAGDLPAKIGGNTGTDLQQMNAVIAYGGKLGSVDLKADVSYAENHSVATSSSSGWRTGINIGFGNVVVGGSYRSIVPIDTGVAALSTNPEEKSFDVGVTYGTGNWAIGLNYLHVEAPKATGTPGNDESGQLFFGASYSLGSGVEFQSNVFRITWEDETTADSANNDGWGALAGISVSF
jgi:predicted porin